MYERLLVPLDGSTSAQMVLPYVVEIAARHNSEIMLVSVSESKATDVDFLYRSYLEHTSEEMRSKLDYYGAKKVKVHDHVLLGRPADEILRYAEDSDANLIIMASRGATSHGPWLLGNIAAKVLWAAKRPVLLIKSPARGEAIERKSVLQRILLPLDGSRIGEAAIPAAEALARPLAAQLVLFQALEPVYQVSAVPELNNPLIVLPVDEKMKAAARAYLDGVGKLLRNRGLAVTIIIEEGQPAERILDYAKSNAIDLIAMSTHGRSGIGRWVFGSVTDKVLHAGDTAVLVVRATQPG